MKKKIRPLLTTILTAFVIICSIFAVSCAKNNNSDSLKFDESALTVNIGDRKMLAISGYTETVTLESSDNNVVGIDGGYIVARMGGKAEITAVSGKATTKMSVTVNEPKITSYKVFNVNTDETKAVTVIDDKSNYGKSVFVAAKKEGKIYGRSVKKVGVDGKCYFGYDELGITDGISEIGAAFVESGDAISTLYISDTVWSSGLYKNENLTFASTELDGDGVLKITSSFNNFGGVIMQIPVTKKNGEIYNPYIKIVAAGGKDWSIKLRRGKGVNDRFEEVVLWDCSVSANRECLIDLNNYSEYVYDDTVSIVMYAINGSLEIKEVYSYCGDNQKKEGVSAEYYIPLTGIDLKCDDVLAVGQSAEINYTAKPADATFARDINIKLTGDCVEYNDGKLNAIKAGQAELICTDYAGNELARKTITVVVKVENIICKNTLGTVTCALSDGSLDLKNYFDVLPSNATTKSVKYEIAESGATVSEDGIMTFTAEGTYSVKIKSADNANKYVVLTVKVLKNLVATDSVTIKGSNTVSIGDEIQYTAECLPENRTFKGVLWRSSDENVATISDEGIATILKAGSFVVRAYSEDGKAYGELKVSVVLEKTVTVAKISDVCIIEMGSDLQPGDIIRVSEKTTVIAESTVGEAEKDNNGYGNLFIQRTIMFSFGSVGTHNIRIVVIRNNEELGGYDIRTIGVYEEITDLSKVQWTAGNNVKLTGGENVGVSLTDNGYGYIESTTITYATYSQATRIVVRTKDKTCSRISIKVTTDSGEYTLTTGDCSSEGVFVFDLSGEEFSEVLKSKKDFTLKIFAIGDKDGYATFDEILLVK